MALVAYGEASQSLVNEGRFPQEVKVEVKEREVKMFVAIPR